MISPDASKVAYGADIPKTGELQIASLGAGRESVAPIACDCYLPWDWSPDGRYLLFWSANRRQVGALDVLSQQQSIVLKHRDYALLRSHFSPDGRWIVFLADVAFGRRRLFVAPFHAMSAISDDGWIPVTEADANTYTPRWAPDGNALYIASSRDGYECLWRQTLEPATKQPVGRPTEVYHLHGARRSISNVPLYYREISVARDRIVFQMSERTGNIWMAEWQR